MESDKQQHKDNNLEKVRFCPSDYFIQCLELSSPPLLLTIEPASHDSSKESASARRSDP